MPNIESTPSVSSAGHTASPRFRFWWRLIRTCLYCIELPIALAVCLGPAAMSYHGPGPQFSTIAIGLTLLAFGGFFIVASIVSPLSRKTLLLGTTGLAVHSVMSVAAIDDGIMLWPGNWSSYTFIDFICFQGSFIAFAALDVFVFIRYKLWRL